MFICEEDKNTVFYFYYFTMFLLPSAAKNRQAMAQKRFKMDFWKHLVILASLFPAPYGARPREEISSGSRCISSFGNETLGACASESDKTLTLAPHSLTPMPLEGRTDQLLRWEAPVPKPVKVTRRWPRRALPPYLWSSTGRLLQCLTSLSERRRN